MDCAQASLIRRDQDGPLFILSGGSFDGSLCVWILSFFYPDVCGIHSPTQARSQAIRTTSIVAPNTRRFAFLLLTIVRTRRGRHSTWRYTWGDLSSRRH